MAGGKMALLFDRLGTLARCPSGSINTIHANKLIVINQYFIKNQHVRWLRDDTSVDQVSTGEQQVLRVGFSRMASDPLR